MKKENDFDKKAKALLITCAIVLIICLIWMGLEFVFYGTVQSREVDDIMMALMSPFIGHTVLYYMEKGHLE